MEMVDAISREGILFVIKAHKDDIESIDEVDTEDGCHSGDFPTRDDGECRDHKGEEHGPRFAEEDLWAEIIYPSDEDGWDKDGETREDENGIDLWRGRRIDEIEFDSQDRHRDEDDEGESGSESRYAIRPVEWVEDEDIPGDCEDERDEVDLERSEDDVVLIEVDDSPEDIGNVTDLDARNPDDDSDNDLHREANFGWDEKRRISSHLAEFFSCFFHITFRFSIEFIDRIEIIDETHECDDGTEYEDDRKSMLIDFSKSWREEESKEEEIEIQETPNTKWNWGSFVSVGCRIIEEPYLLEEVSPEGKDDERRDERESKEDSDAREKRKSIHANVLKNNKKFILFSGVFLPFPVLFLGGMPWRHLV